MCFKFSAVATREGPYQQRRRPVIRIGLPPESRMPARILIASWNPWMLIAGLFDAAPFAVTILLP